MTIGIHSTDKVVLRLSSMNTQVMVCDLSATVGTYAPVGASQCKAAYATLMAAYAQGLSISAYFDNVVTGTSCTSFAPWEIATLRYVGVSG